MTSMTSVIPATASALDVDRETAMAIVSKCSTTPFLVKLWAMLDNTENAAAIEWDATGDSFEVKDPTLMSRDVLPKHFRHNNFSSFQRQLNYFGFRKTGKSKGRGCIYAHDDFCLRRPHDVLRIRRKTNTGGAKGHHTNKCGQLLNLEISPLNTACPAGTSINGRRPTVVNHLKIDVPSRHQHGTRRAVRIKKLEGTIEADSADSPLSSGADADAGASTKRTRPDALHVELAGFAAHHAPVLSGFSGPLTPVTPLSATELPSHTSKRPRLALTAAANVAGVTIEGGFCFDMDPCLSPLSPLRLTEPAHAAKSPARSASVAAAQAAVQSEIQHIFDGLTEPLSASSQPFSPILSLKTPKTPKTAPWSPAPASTSVAPCCTATAAATAAAFGDTDHSSSAGAISDQASTTDTEAEQDPAVAVVPGAVDPAPSAALAQAT